MADAPASLRARVLAAVEPDVDCRRLPEALEEAAERLLTRAKVGPPTRDTALTLLAADALITFACAAIAQSEPALLGERR